MPDRDVEWSLNAKDKSGPAVRGAADGMEKLGREADKTTRKLDDLGDETGQLSRKMLEARAAAAALARQFDKTGDTKLLKDFNKINAEAGKLGRLLKAIKFDPAGDDKAGPKLGIFASFMDTARKAGVEGGRLTVRGFIAAFEGLPGPVKTALVASVVGGATFVAPLLASALSGAVTGAIAGGGIAAGLILAAKDERVAAAYGNMGQRILAQLRESVGKPFAQVLLDEAGPIEEAFNRQMPRLSRVAAGLARDLRPIISDVLSAFDKIMPSVERASAAGGAVLRQMSSQLPGLASAVGRLLDAFAAGGRAGGDALAFLVGSLRALIELMAFGARVSAPMLNILGSIAEFTGLIPEMADGTSHWRDALQSSGSAAMSAAMSYEMLSQSLGNTANQANAANEAFNRLFGEEMSVQQANLAVNMGMQQLTETIKSNKKTLDQHTAAGAQNAQAILSQVDSLERKRQADIAAGNGTAEATAKANSAYNSQVSALRNLLVSMGLTAGEVDKLIGKLYNIPQGRTITITTVFREVGTAPPGYGDAKTGHSRTGSQDYSALSGWAPAEFAAAGRAAFAAAGQGGSGGGVKQPPMEVTSNLALTVELDGAPFRSQAARVTRAAEKRQAWRARVGTKA